MEQVGDSVKGKGQFKADVVVPIGTLVDRNTFTLMEENELLCSVALVALHTDLHRTD